ncbi:MAG: hypothetical protein ACRC6T_14745 [Sarcina sp.]
MKKKIGIISIIVIIIIAVGLFRYNLANEKSENSILFSNQNQGTIASTSNNNIIDLTNNIKLTSEGVRIYLGVGKAVLKNGIKVESLESIGKLRNYVLDWYNCGNQIDSYEESVQCVIPSEAEQNKLYSFTMSSLQSKKFLKKYGTENIMIALGTSNISTPDNTNISPSVLVNGVLAYGFSIFNNKMMSEGNKGFYYGFVTKDGVVIPAYSLKKYGREGKVVVISTGQEIDFNGANNGQVACLV